MKTKTAVFVLLAIPVVFVIMLLAFHVGVRYYSNSDDTQITWDAISVSIVLLEVYIVLFSIGIAMVGIWGFKEIRQSCIKAVREDTSGLIDRIEEKYEDNNETSSSTKWGEKKQ